MTIRSNLFNICQTDYVHYFCILVSCAGYMGEVLIFPVFCKILPTFRKGKFNVFRKSERLDGKIILIKCRNFQPFHAPTDLTSGAEKKFDHQDMGSNVVLNYSQLDH